MKKTYITPCTEVALVEPIELLTASFDMVIDDLDTMESDDDIL